MKKIPTIFKRNAENMSELTRESHEDCAWVFAGEGVATRKYDGSCCLIEGNVLYKRRELRKGQEHPFNFTQVSYDEVTGKTVGWMPVNLDAAEDKWHAEAFADRSDCSTFPWEDGTYELIGPKVQGNLEGLSHHFLMRHDDAQTYATAPRTFDALKDWLTRQDIEGLVFHHPDGRRAKIKKKDFGLDR